MAVLSLSQPHRDCLVSGSYDRTVREFDLRVPVSLSAEHHEHKGPVVSLACSGDYVYTGGEDRRVCVWDRRTRQILQTVKVWADILSTITMWATHTHTHTHTNIYIHR